MASFPQAFGSYVLLKSIAVGSSGEVFLARPADPRRDLPSPLVVKRLHADLAEDEDERRRFKQEAQIAVSVDSPYVARVFDVGRIGDSLFIAMEFVPGWTLARVMADLRAARVPASLPSIRDIVGDALEGLEALHEARAPETGGRWSVVHRDVTPKNLLVGEDSVTRLIDFGSGKSLLTRWRTKAGTSFGAYGYWSPEQARGRPVDRRTDLYAMGVILWELLTSKSYVDPAPSASMLRAALEPNFRPPSVFRPELGPEADALLFRALIVDPAARFQSAGEFRAALLDVFGAREHERASNTVVGAMLWGELEAASTEITRLLADTTTVEVAASRERAQVVAQRFGALDPASTPAPRLEPIDPTQAASAVFRAPASSNAWLTSAFAASIAAIVVTVGATAALIARKRGVSQIPIREPAGPALRPITGREGLEAEPYVAPSGTARPDAPPTAEAVERSGPYDATEDHAALEDEAPSIRKDRRSGRPKRPRRRAEGTTRALEGAPAMTWDHHAVKALIGRARALEKALPPGSEEARAVARVTSDLSMEMSRKQIDAPRAKALAEELQEIELR